MFAVAANAFIREEEIEPRITRMGGKNFGNRKPDTGKIGCEASLEVPRNGKLEIRKGRQNGSFVPAGTSTSFYHAFPSVKNAGLFSSRPIMSRRSTI
jgi:hypothetical protein